MLRSLLSTVLGVVSCLLLALNTLFWAAPLLLLALVKLLLPLAAVRKAIDTPLNALATIWIACNSRWIDATRNAEWTVEGADDLQPGGWYLVNCNHQSWVDIFVLQRALNRRIPFLKFFLKQQLIFVPVIGVVWWALDFPFMKRHSAAEIQRKPQLRVQDLETARRSCARFSLVPTSVMNFAEGTRFTGAKQAKQQSPYQHLLKPKAGALALALNVMGEKFRCLLDITVVYPDGTPSFWNLACGRTGRVIVQVQEQSIPQALLGGDYTGDAQYRAAFQSWLGCMWSEKDARIGQCLAEAETHAR
jgi:1-acyl-sn-glycerol-3-phosphate acyltransferase